LGVVMVVAAMSLGMLAAMNVVIAATWFCF
jgi:hypothetical protein